MTHIKPFPTPRNPNYVDSVNIDDLEFGQEVEVVCSSGRVAVRGSVESLPEYYEEGWEGFSLKTAEGTIDLSVYDAGIVCWPNGQWPSNFHTRYPIDLDSLK